MSLEKKCVVSSCCMILSSSIEKWFPFPDQNSLISSVKDGKTVYYSKRKLWTESLGLTDKWIEKDAVICPLHFKEQDFTVAGLGQVVLKDDAVPYLDVDNNNPQLDVSTGQELKQKENDIETVEKSDDEDDDVEIIEPHREIITLDDDDDECQKGSKPDSGHSDLDKQEDLSVKPAIEQKSRDKDKNTSNTQENESSVHLTCMSPEAITHSMKDIINKQSNAAKSEEIPQATILPNENILAVKNNPKPDSPSAKLRLKEADSRKLKLQCVSADGSKLLVHMPKPGSSKTMPTLAPKTKTPEGTAPKFLTVPGVRKIKILKDTLEKAKVQAKDLGVQNLQKVDVSESVKRQISLLLNKNQIGLSPTDKCKEVKDVKVIKASPARNTLFKILNFPKAVTPPQKLPVDPEKNLKLFKIANGQIYLPLDENKQSVDKQQVSKKNNTERQGAKSQKQDTVQGGSFKYVNIDEIMKNNVQDEPAGVPEEEDALEYTKDKGTQTDMPVGFSDIYHYIKKNIVDFTFDVFGQKYKLRECGLHFEPSTSCKKWDKKVAIVSNSSLSSTDALLLRGMNISIGFSTNKDSPQYKGLNKEVTNKKERLFKHEGGKKLNILRTEMNPPPESKDTNNSVETKKKILDTSTSRKHRNFTETEKNKKVIIRPNLVKLDCKGVKSYVSEVAKSALDSKLKKGISEVHNDETREEKLNREHRKIIRKKKTTKATLARSKKVFRLPISQMNPTCRGRLNVDRNRFKKKKPVQESDKKRRQLGKVDSKKKTESESIASTSFGNESLWDNLEQGESNEESSPIKTRSSRRGKKKDYRSFSTNGTTENMKKSPTKRKKPPSREIGKKKAKYSEKVGAIESFLEVVLEPENADFIHQSSETEKEINEGNLNP